MRRFLMIFATLAILVAFLTECSGSGSPSTLDADLDRARDSIAAGNNPWAFAFLDSLRAASGNDSVAIVRIMLTRGVGAYYDARFEETLLIADSAISFTRSHPEASILRQVAKMAARIKGAYYQQYAYNSDSAINYQKVALSFSDPGDAPDYVVSLANLADAYKLDSRFAEATDTYMRGIRFADSVALPAAKAEPLYSGLAGTWTAIGDYDEAERWWKKAGELYPSMDRFARFSYLNNLGNHYYHAARYPESLQTFDRLRLFLDSIGASEWEYSFCDANRADLFLYQNRLDSAEAILDRISPFLLSTQSDAFVKSQIHTLRMRLLLAKGDLKGVSAMAERYPYSDSLRNEQGLWRLSLLEDLYSRTGDWHRAYETRRRWNTLNDSLLSERVRQNLDAKRLEYERDKSILSLRADHSRSQANVLRLMIILGLSLLVILILVLFFVVGRRRAAGREERMLRKIMDLRLESGRSRVTPHFIYNALNQILLDNGEESSSGKPLRNLVGLLRRQQTMTDHILIPLSEELQFLDCYVEVQGARSAQPLDYGVAVEDGLDPRDYLVPSMALQILAENAFKHGFTTLTADSARILNLNIRFSEDRKSMVMEMTNNTASDYTPAPSSGIGLRIISQTIEYLNHRFRTDIRFSSSIPQPSLWRASLTIPLEPRLEDFDLPSDSRAR